MLVLTLDTYILLEYPSLRSFTLFPGIVLTPLASEAPEFIKYAKDHAELAGMLCLYLADPRADFLKGMVMSVNWDVEEVEAHKDEIAKQNLLQIKWMPILPASGDHGFD